MGSPAPRQAGVLPDCRSCRAVMFAVHAAAGGQQQLRPRQFKRGRARNQQQHPVHQQVGNKPLHLLQSSPFPQYPAATSAIRLNIGTECDAERDCRSGMCELLGRGGIILTGNARAARALHRLYAKRMQAQGAVAWPAPQILDLHSWLAEQWKSSLLTGTEDRLLLNDLQERALWESMIAPAIKRFSLVDPGRMAELAHDAYSLLANYDSLGRLDDSMWTADASAEPEIFHRWARTFQQECTRQRWIPRCELIEAVTHAFEWARSRRRTRSDGSASIAKRRQSRHYAQHSQPAAQHSAT